MKLIIAVASIAACLTAPAVALQSDAGPSECTPPLKDCKSPIIWVADKGDCSCFACDYGKSTAHPGCTKDKKRKAELERVARVDADALAQSSSPVFVKGILRAEGAKVIFV